MDMTDITLISREYIGHGEVIERVINRAGVPYTAILKYGKEVASAPTAQEQGLIHWWQSEGWQLWKEGKPKRLTKTKT